MPKMRVRWRVVVRVDGVILYANRADDIPLPRVRWSTLSHEYPDHFFESEALMISEYYSDQGPYLQKIRLAVEEETDA